MTNKDRFIEYYNRNGFKYWKIEDSKNKEVAVNTYGSAGSVEDPNGEHLAFMLDMLENTGVKEKYTVTLFRTNGERGQSMPYLVTAQLPTSNSYSGTDTNMLVAFGKLQSDNQYRMEILQKEREIERLREEKEKKKTSLNLAGSITPKLIEALAPQLVKGFIDLGSQSPIIKSLFEELASDEMVRAGIKTVVQQYFKSKMAQNGEVTTT